MVTEVFKTNCVQIFADNLPRLKLRGRIEILHVFQGKTIGSRLFALGVVYLAFHFYFVRVWLSDFTTLNSIRSAVTRYNGFF